MKTVPISIIVFLLTIGTQLTATIYAMFLIRLTGRKLAWISISLALALMTLRRIVEFTSILTSSEQISVNISALIALITSFLMLLGVLRIRNYFQSIHLANAVSKKAEEEVRHALKRVEDEKSKAEAIIEAIGDGVTIQDSACKILYQNRMHVTLFGNHVGEHCYMAYEGMERTCEECPVAMSFKDGKIHTMERSVHTDNGMKYFENTSSALKDSAGKIIAGIELVRDITERKLMEESLQESENKFRDLAEKSLVGIYLIQDGKFSYVNPTLAEIFGYAVEELIDKRGPEDLVLTEDWPIVMENLRKRVYGEIESSHYNFRGVKKNKEIIEIEAYGSKTIYKTRPAVIGTLLDVTTRKRADQELRESEEKFRVMFESSLDAIMTLEPPSWRFTSANSATVMMFGAEDEEEFISHGSWELSPDCQPDGCASDEKAMEMIETAMREGSCFFEWTHKRVSGEEFSADVLLTRMEQAGKMILQATVRDITDRKRTEAALRKSEEFNRNILESVGEGFLVIDRDYHIISANRAFCEQEKTSLSEIVGKPCYLCSHHIDKPCHELGIKCPLELTFETGQPNMALHVHQDKNGNPIHVEIKSFPLKDASGTVTAVIEIINNITETKKLEDQLRHAQKMEAVGTLAGGIAHDFNNMLNIILGYGSMVMDGLGADNPLRHHMNELLVAAEKAANLTKRLLVFSRKQVVAVKPVNVNALIIDIREMISRIIGEDIEIDLILAEKSLVVMADTGQIEQVMMNLATNARDAMPNGGTLKISSGIQEIGDEYIATYGYGKHGKYALITVADTGHGIDAETQKNIFEPFFTTKGIGEGTGLGLAISYEIIKQHSGYITVHSEPGQGTMFNIYLPLTEELTIQDNVKETPGSGKAGNETILVAEDDASLRKLIRIVLESSGYSVIMAEDGEEAIAKFMENRDRIDLVLLDMIMPKKSGKDVSEVIRKVSPMTKILFASGYTMDRINTQELTEAGFDFILKPIAPNDLLRKVREILDK